MGNDRNSLQKQLADILFQLDLEEYEEYEAERLRKLDEQLKSLAEAEPPPVSEVFHKRIVRTLRARPKVRKAHRKFHTGRVASLTAAILLLISLTLTVFGDDLYGFFVTIHEKFLTVGNRSSQFYGDAYADLEGLYLPTYLPDEYNYASRRDTALVSVVVFDGPDEQKIIFSQYQGGTQVILSGKDADVTEKIRINDMDGIIVVKNGITNVIWGTEPRFMLTGQGAREELVEMARSVAFGGAAIP